MNDIYKLATFFELGAAIHDASSKGKGAVLKIDRDSIKYIDDAILYLCRNADKELMMKAIMISEEFYRENDN